MPQLGTLQGLATRFANVVPETTPQNSALAVQQAMAGLANRSNEEERRRSAGLAELFAGVNAKDPKDSITSDKYDPDTYMKTLKGIESSGGDYGSINERTGAMGAYQFLPSTLKALQERTGEAFSTNEFINNPKLQDRYFKMLVNDNVKTLQNMDIPVNNFTLWAAHNLGPTQAKELMGSGELSPRTRAFIKSNLPGQEPTRENYIKTYGPKFGMLY